MVFTFISQKYFTEIQLLFISLIYNQHVLTTCWNFFSHEHKHDNTSNCTTALHLAGIISAQLWDSENSLSHLSQNWSNTNITISKMLGWKLCQYQEVLTNDYLGIWFELMLYSLIIPTCNLLNCAFFSTFGWHHLVRVCWIAAEACNCLQPQINAMPYGDPLFVSVVGTLFVPSRCHLHTVSQS